MELNTAQLYLTRSLLKQGWPADLLDQLLNRCGATEEDWQALLGAGYVTKEAGRFVLTEEGWREFKHQKQGRWF